MVRSGKPAPPCARASGHVWQNKLQDRLRGGCSGRQRGRLQRAAGHGAAVRLQGSVSASQQGPSAEHQLGWASARGAAARQLPVSWSEAAHLLGWDSARGRKTSVEAPLIGT